MGKGNIFNIPAGQPFLTVLAEGLKARWQGDALARVTVLLPTRRACLALRDVFLEVAYAEQQNAHFVPRLKTLSETDDDFLLLSAEEDVAQAALHLPPAMPPLKRRMLLASLIFEKAELALSFQQSFLLAGELGAFLDNAIREGCDLATLETLVEGAELSQHWMKTASFLSLLRDEWPRILKQHGAMDAVARSMALKQKQIEEWQRKAPPYPVVAAGSTGSHPITGKMLKAMLSMPQGMVVLSCLDQELEEEAWNGLEPSHPQYLLKKLLARLGVQREDVSLWQEGRAASARASFWGGVMRPAETTASWRHGMVGGAESIRGLELLVAEHEQQEAVMAALLLRQKGVEEKKRVALVTPQRGLAKRVAGILHRWHMVVDDSAGQPLAQSRIGDFFLRLIPLFNHDCMPSELLDVLKHPYATAGLGRAACLSAARELEKEFFCQAPQGRGFAAWCESAKHLKEQKHFAFLYEIARALSIQNPNEEKPLKDWLAAHKALASFMAEDAVLWRGPDGLGMAAFLEECVEACGQAKGHFQDYAALFSAALEGHVLRSAYGQHPHIFILGLQEARLLSFDAVILAGLNETVWPEERRQDPWMSAAMRTAFGLPHPDQPTGQTAHDFVQLACQPEVVLLRSARMGEAPTIPSRWLLRMDAVLRVMGVQDSVVSKGPWQTWARDFDRAETLEPCAPPAIKLPPIHRPKTFSATDIELLLQDPYAYYAKKILKLKPVNDVDGAWGARERGTAIHKALHEVGLMHAVHWPPEAEHDFYYAVLRHLKESGCPAEDMKLATPRLRFLARAYWNYERERRAGLQEFKSEIEGRMAVGSGDYHPLITAKADKIELRRDGQLAILDYKTGAIPKNDFFISALKPQLLIEALIAKAGGFPTLPARGTQGYIYVRMSDSKELVEPREYTMPDDELMTVHGHGLAAFITAMFDDAAVLHAAPRPFLLPPQQDYARLARVAEWSKGALEQDDS